MRTGAAWGALLAAGRLGLMPGAATAQDATGTDTGEPFSAKDVLKRAEALAGQEFERPTLEAAPPFNALSVEQFRDIRFRPEQALWQPHNLGVEVHLLPRGWIYETPVEISIVENGKARRLVANNRMFSFGPKISSAPAEAPYAFSGFRLQGPIDRGDEMNAFAVFQGASYFRARGRDQTFGLSARGLAVNTAQPSGEEFPIFRAFWIERPRIAGGEVVVHALLDSRSVSGAYRFVIRQSANTIIDVDAVLYPRRSLKHIGLAPLTSMFLRGPAQRRVNHDIRPSVHNSQGLAILNGRGERLWRPLTNPRTLQTSAFMDDSPRGFGLLQRDRRLSTFEDLNARFDKRPSLWVEPRGNWGKGFVELVEIPSEEEIHDNIVVYWNPVESLEPGKAHNLSYRLHWGEDMPIAPASSHIVQTAVGLTRKDTVRQFAIDFSGPAVSETLDLPIADLSAGTGTLSSALVERHPGINGVRVSFTLDTGSADMSELRLTLKRGDQYVSETWLYRWTA